MEELLDAVAEVDLDGNPTEALDRFARFHITFHLDRAEAVFISYMELRNLTPENFAHIAQQRGSYEALLEGILKRGHRSGHSNSRPLIARDRPRISATVRSS